MDKFLAGYEMFLPPPGFPLRPYYDAYVETINVEPEAPPKQVEENRPFLRKIHGIFKEQELSHFVDALRNHPRNGPSISFPGGIRKTYVSSSIRPFSVKFDHNGKVVSLDFCLHTIQNQVIRSLIIRSMESLGEAFHWKDTERYLAFNASLFQSPNDALLLNRNHKQIQPIDCHTLSVLLEE